MRFLVAILLIFMSLPSLAGPACPSLHRGLMADALLHRTTVIGDEDNRETIPDYANKRGLELKDVQKKYSATGVFHCGGYSGAANLVHKNNRIVLSAHQFYDQGTCKKKMGGNFSSCYVEFKESELAEPTKYYLNLKTLELGTQCPMSFAGEDWAVVDLLKEVKGVQSYRIANVKELASRDNDYEDLLGQKITILARRNANFKNHPLQTSSLCDGEIGGVQSALSSDKSRTDYFMATNCSWGHGNSGGGVFLQSGEVPTLIGVVAGGIGKDYQPFGADNYLGAALIEGKLYQSIVRGQQVR